ncbi:MAG: hypothetical protein RMJ98_00990 [Myxococcales bacterium]|nr:hypothetical protein [Polyangiaceae bacterium]MDW8247862.1 hypothetical protein [Myxococcales bacterium]
MVLAQAEQVVLQHPSRDDVLVVSRRISEPSLTFDTFLLRGAPRQIFLGPSYLLASLGPKGVQYLPLP